jgi:predicted MFS family arabinose efflux permease
MMAVLSSAWVIPGLIGPSLSGAVAEHLTWRLVFLGILPLVVIGGACTLPYLRRMGPPESHTHGGGPIALMREVRGVLPAVLVLALVTLTFFGAEAYIPLALSEVRDYGPAMAGLALTAGTLSWTAGSWLQERRAETWSRKWVIRTGLLLIGAGIALLLPLAAPATPVWLAAVSWAIAGLGIGMAYPGLSLAILGSAPPGREGAASAAIQTSTVVGSAAGTGIGGVIVALGAAGAWSTGAGVTLVFATMLGFVVIALVAARRLAY